MDLDEHRHAGLSGRRCPAGALYGAPSSAASRGGERSELFEIEELSMKDVALAIGCPEKTAYGRLYAAREALKRAFLKLDPEGGPT